jgi:uncharacterized protein YprB with RNaseH-like and TPR domain
MTEEERPRPSSFPRLKNRLGYLQPFGTVQKPSALPPVKSPGGAGWEQVGEHTFRRLVRRAKIPGAAGVPAELSQHLVPPGLGAEKLMVFDTETTGLSAGAGTFIFLMGTGWLEADAVCYEQIFAADFPGEPEFLDLVAGRLSGSGLLVSYNGKGFDSHVLRTRFALNSRECRLGEQLDLLYWARRLWKRPLGDCSLGNIERRVLGVRRREDIPGFEIPGVYLDFLRSGEEGRLRLVFEHNLQDLDSLFRLFFLCNEILVSERSPVPADQTALGSYLVKRMDDRGVLRLEMSFRSGDMRAAQILSLFYKRRQRWREAVAVWRKMAAQAQSLFAVVELAKYYEHRRREPGAALEWVKTGLAWKAPLESKERCELEKRKRRLQLRLEKSLKNGNS